MYKSLCARAVKAGAMCDFSKVDFIAWCIMSDEYKRLFDSWEKSGFIGALNPMPTFPRHVKWISLNDIRFVTTSLFNRSRVL